MLNNISFGKYILLNSKIHNCHPFCKLVIAFILIFSIVFTNSLFLNLIYTLVLIVLIILSKISWKIYVQSFLKMRFFLLFLLIINIIFSGSLSAGVFIVWKMILILLASSILLYTTSSSEMIYGIKTMMSPLCVFHISSNKIAFSLSLALRFIPILLEQAHKIWKSQLSRGLSFYEMKLKDKVKSLKTILLPMFVLSIKRADILSETMEVRLFNLYGARTNYKNRKMSIQEKIILVLVILQFLLVIFLEVFK